jgi:hypothetical protein
MTDDMQRVIVLGYTKKSNILKIGVDALRYAGDMYYHTRRFRQIVVSLVTKGEEQQQ